MSYPGSKGQDGVWQQIIGQMPPHHTYVEAFYGSGKIFHAKRLATRSILIDKNDAVRPKGLNPNHQFVHGDAIEIFKTWIDWQIFLREPVPQIGTLIYCDPPYPLSTRAGRKYYDHEMTDDDHATLLSTLLQLRCYVMISSYPNALYLEQLREWRCVRYQTMTRGGKRTECLWCNFPEPTELHDWRFAGRNFRERWNYEKARRNILAKIDAMPPRKRGFVLNAIASRIPAPDSALVDRAAGNAANDVATGGNVKSGATCRHATPE